MSKLSDRLADLGIKKAVEIIPPQIKREIDIETFLSASRIRTNLGDVIHISSSLMNEQKFGNVILNYKIDHTTLDRIQKITESDIEKYVFLDCETTGLSGGTGILSFLVGVGSFSSEGFKLSQYFIEDPSQESALLLELSNFLANFQTVVSFNGKSFDIPLLKTRYLMNKMESPFEGWSHLDLLHISRRLWRDRLENRSLKDLEREILEITRSDDEIPGWMIPGIYMDYLRSGDPVMIKNVIYHNSLDIFSLAALFIKISTLIDFGRDDPELEPLDLFAIGKLFENNGEYDKAIIIYEKCVKVNNLAKEYAIDLNARLAGIYKRQSNWENATAAWLRNIEFKDYSATIEMSMYYEHKKCDYQEALTWARNALLLNDEIIQPHYRKTRQKGEIMRRIIRLEKRIKNV
jgi:uncharacterized protein